MPRQTFISKEFFVNALEKDTRVVILSLPKYIEDIKFVTQHSVTHTITFLYQNAADKKIYRTVVSLLPLNDEYTQINIHISYTNDQAFYNDNGIKQALINFECAIQAAIKGDASLYLPVKPKVTSSRKLLRFVQTVFTSTGGYFSLKRMT